MFGFFTIVAFVIAWKAGGWWWLIAIVMGLAWYGKRQQEKPQPKDPPLSVNQPETNDWVIMLTEICSNYSASDFFVSELIPEPKLKNATKSYPLPDGGKPIALIDTTIFGGAGDGMLIGEHGISWHNLATETKVSSLRWKEFSATTLSIDGSDIKFGDIGVFDAAGLGKEKVIELLKAIQVGYADYRKHANSHPTNGKDKVEIDINRASFDDLLSLPGVGAAEAKMIIARRESIAFQSLDDLSNFIGLKPHQADQLRGRVIFTGPDPLPTRDNSTPQRGNNQDSSKMPEPPVIPEPSRPGGQGGRVID